MTAPFALIGDAVTTTGRCRAAVVVDGKKIADLLREPRSGDLPENRREVPGLICPGFIDLQINGGFGHDVGPDREALAGLALELPKTGVTSFLPTAVSWPSQQYAPFLDMVRSLLYSPGAQVLGAHLEGPFLSPARPGAHDPRNLRPIDLDLLREMMSAGVVRVMTLAPELLGAREAIQLLVEMGAVASAGHTDATYQQVLQAIDAGLSLGTHLFNAMSPLNHRAPGTVGALLSTNRARAGIIADGIHVAEGALTVAYQAKGPGGLALVTDATEAAGMPPGDYELSGRTVRLVDGAVRLPDGTLAGSALTMDQAVRNAASLLDISLETAVIMATATAADVLGLKEKGRIRIGADADLTVLADDGSVQETIVGGEIVYRSSDNGED